MKRYVKIFLRLLVFVVAVFFFWFCAWNSAFLEPLPIERGFILALMLCLFGILAFVTGRLSVALIVSGALFFGLKFISVMKLLYLNSPLMPEDFVYFTSQSLFDTLKQYPHLLHIGIAVVVVLPLLLWLVWYLDIPFLARVRKWWLRVGLHVAGAVCCVLILSWCMSPGGPFASVYQTGLWSKLSSNAHLTNFFLDIRTMTPDIPDVSSRKAAIAAWSSTRTVLPKSMSAPGGRPDIIQVLEESTFDPSDFAGCTIPQCHVAMFEPDVFTKAHGFLRTHTFGGGTWVSEFSSFSGMPQDIFGPAGMYAPYVLAPRLKDSLPMLLDRLGYETIAVYPVDGSFINARDAYKHYGFDKFYGAKDLGLKVWHTSDTEMFEAAKRVYDENKKPGQPIFMMILTLNQHGPHDTTPLKDLPAPFNKGLLPGLPPKQELNLSAYLSRLQGSDKGMVYLKNTFLHRDRPTVLMYFGDHQPSFSGVIRKMKRKVPPGLEPYKDYLTYFMISSNFQGPSLPPYPMTDIAYLPGMVLKVAGLPPDSYFSALDSFETRCKGRYEDCLDKQLVESYYYWIFDELHVFE